MRSEEILKGLETIANQYSTIAILWHILIYVLIIALVSRWEPTNRLFSIILTIPALSVSILAWLNGNPFNGTTFLVLAVLLLFFAMRTSVQVVSFSSTPYMIIGILMVAFGLIYPHFIESSTLFKYFYASPLGLVPCPTLSVLIGFVLIYNGFGSQATQLVVLIFGLFYGLFGVFKLGVYLDTGLIIGSLTLLVKYLLMIKPLG